jgi:hypothetical protein
MNTTDTTSKLELLEKEDAFHRCRETKCKFFYLDCLMGTDRIQIQTTKDFLIEAIRTSSMKKMIITEQIFHFTVIIRTPRLTF